MYQMLLGKLQKSNGDFLHVHEQIGLFFLLFSFRNASNDPRGPRSLRFRLSRGEHSHPVLCQPGGSLLANTQC